jgi:hypothetical protein
MSALRWPQTVQINWSCDIGDEAGPVCLGARAHCLNFLAGRQLGYISILNRNGDTALIDRKRAPLPKGARDGSRARAAGGMRLRSGREVHQGTPPLSFFELDFLSDRRDRVSIFATIRTRSSLLMLKRFCTDLTCASSARSSVVRIGRSFRIRMARLCVQVTTGR